MPKELERKLTKEAHKKGFGKERTNAYVYGTLSKIKAQTAGEHYVANYGKSHKIVHK